VLPDNYFEEVNVEEHNEALISSTGRGIKLAEGGNFSDLVRKNRPPGNFASSFVNAYTAAPIPVCAGVRFAIGKLAELLYLDVTLSVSDDNWIPSELLQKSSLDKQGMDVLRRSLGHPLNYAETVHCLVASVHGMDAASAPERFLVAARLWSEGVSAEYLPQSGVVLSLLNRLHVDSSDDDSSASDWSLLELQGVCALLKIPFIVIVQSHLLKDKSSVRLRQVSSDTMASSSTTGAGNSNEMVVSLDNLASTILGASTGRAEEATEDEDAETSFLSPSAGRIAQVDCVFIDNDQYWGNDREISRNETPHYKTYLKSLKSVKLSAESYLSSFYSGNQVGWEGVPVFAVNDVPFMALREFGSALMRREEREQSAAGAASEISEKYPKHKRSLKTLATAIDNYMRHRLVIWDGGSSRSLSHGGSSYLTTVLLYSKMDDRFDMVTLNSSNKGRNGVASSHKRK
jgi:hypothetical protein